MAVNSTDFRKLHNSDYLNVTYSKFCTPSEHLAVDDITGFSGISIY